MEHAIKVIWNDLWESWLAKDDRFNFNCFVFLLSFIIYWVSVRICVTLGDVIDQPKNIEKP